MLKFMMITTILFSFAAHAKKGTGGCSGTYQGKKIVVNAMMSDIDKLESGTGSVSIDGRLLARFEGRDLKINLLGRSFTIENDQGDSASGKLTNIFTKSGILEHLSIPAYGVNIRNVKMDCWTKKD